MKLGSKITLGITLLVTLALGIYGWINLSVRRDDLLAEMEREVRSQGTALQEAIEQAMRSERSKEEIRRLVDRIARAERTLQVAVFNRKGNPLLRAENNRSIEDWNRVRWVLESGTATHARPGSNQPAYSFYFPIFGKGGEVVGAARVTREAGYLDGYIKDTRDRLIVAMAALVLALAAAVFLAVRQALGRPIAWLVDGIDNVARGDLDYTLATDRKDEIGAIASSFNAMTAQLKRAREDLVQANHDRLEAERRLRQSEKLAAIGQLAAQLAHEIGTPLNVIGGRARTLVKKADDPSKVEKNAEIIAEQATRITKIIRQLLDVARRRAPEHERVDLCQVAESTLAFLSEELLRHRVAASLEVRSDATRAAAASRPGPVLGDADGLTQVVLNLCMNALQSMPDGGKLTLTVGQVVRRKQGLDHTPEVPHVVVEVADTGVGIAEEHRDKIFEPFFTHRTDGSATGTGLGLPVALGIVKDHDGWIELLSEPGRGSCFRVYLPAATEERQAEVLERQEAEARASATPSPVAAAPAAGAAPAASAALSEPGEADRPAVTA